MTDERLEEIGELLQLLGKETRHGPLPRQTENKLLQAAFEMFEEVKPPAGVEGLKPCPFCGGEAEFERKGTGRQSCIVRCTDCGASHESGDTWDSGSSWNQRA